ncbi:MAG: hypothetical protein R3F62_21365 [Planctomycetota bacterium]
MSDRRLRELERRWGETGDPEDEAALVRARLQAGVLDGERLALAATCGSSLAQSLLPAPLEVPDVPADWGEELLRRWGPEPLIRVAHVALEGVLATLPAREPSRLDLDPLIEGALRPALLELRAALEGWLREPPPAPRRPARRTAEEVGRVAVRFSQAVALSRRGPREGALALTAREQALGRALYPSRPCAVLLGHGPPRQRTHAARQLATGAVFALDPVDAEAGLARAAGPVAAWALGHPTPLGV